MGLPEVGSGQDPGGRPPGRRRFSRLPLERLHQVKAMAFGLEKGHFKEPLLPET